MEFVILTPASKKSPPPDISSLLKRSADFLETKGSPTPRLDAELLLAEVLGMSRVDLYVNFERPLNRGEVDHYRELVKKRGKREPVAYILGRAYFGDLTLKVDRSVLIPRPETEHLVEVSLYLLKERKWARSPEVLDLGTGSGAIAISIADGFDGVRVTAVDDSPDALALARENARVAGAESMIEYIQSNLFKELDPLATFDLIVSNPPYISDEEWQVLAPDVRDYEPERALRGGLDGLDFYRHLAVEAHQFLKPDGCLVLEIGYKQKEAVTNLLIGTGRYAAIEIVKDYSGHDRVVVARRAESDSY